jgi:hypothetical protein
MEMKKQDEGTSKRMKVVDLPNVDPLDIGRFVSMEAIDDDTKLNLINNDWKPPPTFNFPLTEYGKTCSERRKFTASWLNRWSWLCYSKLHDGAFCLSCVLFGQETGHNCQKLNKLFKEPLTNWKSAATKLQDHHQHSTIHHDSMMRMMHFRTVMMGERKGFKSKLISLEVSA